MSILPYGKVLPTVPENVFIAPGAWVIGDVVIGERSSIWFNTIVRGDVNYIRIGSYTTVQDDSTLHVTPPNFPLQIGNRVVIGHRAVVHGCIVEDECMIGIGAIVLDGAKIGTGSIVAAGAVVTPGTMIPPGSMVMGAPAQVKRATTEAERERIRLTCSHYADLAARYLEAGAAKGGKVKGFLG